MRTSPARTSSRAGFTLIEFALVLLILGIVFALALPRIPNPFSAAPLDASAGRMARAIEGARKQALVSGRPVRLRVKVPEGSWRFEALGEDGRWRRLSEPLLPAGGVTEGVRLLRARVGGGPARVDGEALLRFSPTGESDPAVLSLGAKEKERSVVVLPLRMSVEIRHGRVEKAGS